VFRVVGRAFLEDSYAVVRVFGVVARTLLGHSYVVAKVFSRTLLWHSQVVARCLGGYQGSARTLIGSCRFSPVFWSSR